MVFELDSNEFIGRAGFSDFETGETEMGYPVLKKYWGQGYATRILQTLLNWAKNNTHKDKIIAFTSLTHKASERVMQKAGMNFMRVDHLKGVDCVVHGYRLTV